MPPAKHTLELAHELIAALPRMEFTMVLGTNAGGVRRCVQLKHQRYLALAQEARLKGDIVEAENWYQHAEHYFRLMNDR